MAGVLSLADALVLVAARSELMNGLAPGVMLSVDLAEEELVPLLGPGNALAVGNGPSLCIVGGLEEPMAALEARLAERGINSRRLRISHASHTAMMEPILDRFAETVARVELRPPAVPYLSNLTGDWITAAEATDPGSGSAHCLVGRHSAGYWTPPRSACRREPKR